MAGSAVYIGNTVLILFGIACAGWPQLIAEWCDTDDDNNPTTPSPTTITWTRILGVGLVLFGLVQIWYGPAAFRGPANGPLI